MFLARASSSYGSFGREFFLFWQRNEVSAPATSCLRNKDEIDVPCQQLTTFLTHLLRCSSRKLRSSSYGSVTFVAWVRWCAARCNAVSEMR